MAKIGDVGTLRELDVKPGDVVEGVYCGTGKKYTVTVKKRDGRDVWYESGGFDSLDGSDAFRLISRATTQPKIWRDLSSEEKGALLLAAYEGKVIEYFNGKDWHVVPRHPDWYDYQPYRIKPEPVRETVKIYGSGGYWTKDVSPKQSDTHRITFDTIDGVPDCSSVKMKAI